VESCPSGSLRAGGKGIEIDRKICVACAACVKVCPTAAMELKGEVWNLDALISEITKDRSFFGKEGGVTFSGGEALMQAEFVIAAVKILKEQGIHTAIDTAGCVPESAMKGVLENADLILYDLKLADPAAHKRFTAADNTLVLKNAKLAAAYHKDYKINGPERPEIWIRTPIIPGATDSEENITRIGAFIADHMNESISRWELISFNNLCQSKYNRLGLTWDFESTPLIKAEKMEALVKAAKESGADPSKILWTGSTFMEG
jgi:pyruvate formate lyase activating enzyme